MIKSDKWIRVQGEKLIKPFHPEKVRKGVVSYGTSQAGYDLTLGEKAFYFKGNSDDVDVKSINDKHIINKYAFDGVLYINPRQSLLCAVNEELTMPDNIMGLVWGKSTYSRVGVNVYCQPVEPGWKGYLSILVVNYNPNPVKLYANEGIAQIVFFELDEDCEVPYNGKYQNQENRPTFSKIDP